MDKKWYSTDDLTKLWGILHDDIIDFMMKGLKAHVCLGDKKVFALKYGLPLDSNILKKDGSQEKNIYLRIYWDKLTRRFHCRHIVGEVLADLRMDKNYYFLREDVLTFAEEHDLPFWAQDTEDKVRTSQQDEPQTAIEKQTTISAENYFHRDGNGWRIGYRGGKGTFTDVKYIRYIAYLLEKPGSAIPALDLFHDHENNTYQAGFMRQDQALEEGLSLDSAYKDEEVTEKTRIRMEKISSEMQMETDPIIKQELEYEFQCLVKKVKNTNRLVDDQGNPTKLRKNQKIDDPLRKNAQTAVRKGLRSAYKSLRKAGLKKLAKHLEDSIKTDGNYDFKYQNVKTVMSWDIKF